MKKVTHLAVLMLAVVLTCPVVGLAVEEDAGGRSVFIAAHEVLATYGARSVHVLVDYRSEQDFARAHIPHALNVSLHSLETLPMLKDRRVVLVGTGVGVAEACLRAEALNREGWRVYVLAGGLPAWKDEGGPLIGDAFAVEECRIVSWGQILADRMFSSVTVVVLDPTHDSISMAQAYAPMTPDPDEPLAVFLERLAATCQEGPICLADASGAYPHRLVRMAQAAGLKRYFLIRGGLSALVPPDVSPALSAETFDSDPSCPSCDLR